MVSGFEVGDLKHPAAPVQPPPSPDPKIGIMSVDWAYPHPSSPIGFFFCTKRPLDRGEHSSPPTSSPRPTSAERSRTPKMGHGTLRFASISPSLRSGLAFDRGSLPRCHRISWTRPLLQRAA